MKLLTDPTLVSVLLQSQTLFLSPRVIKSRRKLCFLIILNVHYCCDFSCQTDALHFALCSKQAEELLSKYVES